MYYVLNKGNTMKKIPKNKILSNILCVLNKNIKAVQNKDTKLVNVKVTLSSNIVDVINNTAKDLGVRPKAVFEYVLLGGLGDAFIYSDKKKIPKVIPSDAIRDMNRPQQLEQKRVIKHDSPMWSKEVLEEG